MKRQLTSYLTTYMHSFKAGDKVVRLESHPSQPLAKNQVVEVINTKARYIQVSGYGENWFDASKFRLVPQKLISKRKNVRVICLIKSPA